MSLDVYLIETLTCDCGKVHTLGNCVYTNNITHNLNKMAEEAGIYQHLWRPEELDIKFASQLIEPLEAGLSRLYSDPDHYKEFNPTNGWGDYSILIHFVESYRDACIETPSALIEISR